MIRGSRNWAAKMFAQWLKEREALRDSEAGNLVADLMVSSGISRIPFQRISLFLFVPFVILGFSERFVESIQRSQI